MVTAAQKLIKPQITRTFVMF